MKRLSLVFLILICLSLAVTANAQLTISGSLSTATPPGVTATGYWGEVSGFQISWLIEEQADHSWYYQYDISDISGNRLEKGANSHLTIEVSPNVTSRDFWEFSFGGDVEFGDKDDITNAMKLDWEADTYSFFSNRAPVEGSFYAENGFAGDRGQNAAWNSDGYTIWRPDTTNGMIPEPSTFILLASGLFGMGLRRRFKKQ